MKHLLNTLYVTSQNSWVHKDGEAASVVVGQEVKLRVPVHGLASIVCFGQVSVSPPLMELCNEQGVGICFLSEQGKFMARVEGPVSGNVLLRKEQYRRSDDLNASVAIAKMMVGAKICNSRSVLSRLLRDHPDRSCENIKLAIDRLDNLKDKVVKDQLSLDTVTLRNP